MSVPLLLIVVLLVLALGGGWGFYRGGAYGPWSGGLGLVVVVIIVFLLMNRL